MKIQTSTVSLSTLAVTIQALQVDGKQMTLSVFRQLPQTSLYNSEGQRDERLTWWGLVRYAIKDSGDKWMVADRGGIIYRAPVFPTHLYVVELAGRIGQAQKALTLPGTVSFYDGGTRTKAYIEEAIGELKQEYELMKLKDIVTAQAVQMPQLFIAI